MAFLWPDDANCQAAHFLVPWRRQCPQKRKKSGESGAQSMILRDENAQNCTRSLTMVTEEWKITRTESSSGSFCGWEIDRFPRLICHFGARFMRAIFINRGWKMTAMSQWSLSFNESMNKILWFWDYEGDRRGQLRWLRRHNWKLRRKCDRCFTEFMINRCIQFSRSYFYCICDSMFRFYQWDLR